MHLLYYPKLSTLFDVVFTKVGLDIVAINGLK